MTHPAILIERKAATLRTTFKKLEKNARKNGHVRRMKLYNFVQTRLKRFANWFFTLWSEETQELMLASERSRYQIHGTNVPEWVALRFTKDGCIEECHGN
jgi:hypothetical protein